MKHKIYTDGSGNGRIAWYNETTGKSWGGQEKGVTNNQAEYLAIYNALKSTSTENVEILSDSKLVVNQLNRKWHIKDDRLRELFDRIQELISSKKLNVKFVWVRRKDNPAGKYLG